MSKPDTSKLNIERLIRENDALKARIQQLESALESLGNLTQRQEVIHRISERMNTYDLKKISNIAATEIGALVGAKLCSLYLYDYSNNELFLVAKSHPHAIDETVKVSPKEPPTVMRTAVLKRQLVHVVNFDNEAQANFQRPNAANYATKSCVSVPLIVGQEQSRLIVGVINFADKEDGTFFDEISDLPTLKQMTQYLAIVLRNCKLFEEVQKLAATDGLTKLLNYRKFYENVTTELHRAKRYGRPLSFIMIDVDDFKGINDKHGHRAGDYALYEVARIIKKNLRQEDIVARYGGDEIAVVLPETTLGGAEIVANRLRETVEAGNFQFNGAALKVTISLGVAQYTPDLTISDFLNVADKALYQSKQTGKNKVTLHAKLT